MKTSIEECKRIINSMPVEFVRVLDFIIKLEQELQELEKKKQTKED